jgi:hypothetical protein
MSISFTKESKELFVVRIEGLFTFDDQKEIEKRIRNEIDRDQKAKFLILAEQFSGWGMEGDWSDLTFMYESDPYIEKIAIVAKKQWAKQILMHIGSGTRQASVEFFLPAEEKAREWLLNK